MASSPWSNSRNFWISASPEEETAEDWDGVGGVCCAEGAATGCVVVVVGRGGVSVGFTPEETAEEEGEDQNQPMVVFALFEGVKFVDVEFDRVAVRKPNSRGGIVVEIEARSSRYSS